MSLSMGHCVQRHSKIFGRMAGLGLFSASLLGMGALGCARRDTTPSPDSTPAVAATMADTSTRPAAAPTGLVTSASTGETTAQPAAAVGGGRPTAAAPEARDSLCSTENGSAGVQPGKPGADPLLVNQSEYDGWKMFHVYCYRCHGVDALGGGIGPDLRHSLGPEGSVDHACFIKTVTEGRLPKGMPSWTQLLEPDQIENIWHYLQARSSGRLAPGRPHKKS